MMSGSNNCSPCILWSSILRDDTMLVEARCIDVDNVDDENCRSQQQQQQQQQRQQRQSLSLLVGETSRLLLSKKPTPGWEHATLHKAGGFGRNNKGTATKLKGTKFHVYEHYNEDIDDHSEEHRGSDKFGKDSSLVTNTQKNQNGLTIWTFACVYDPSSVDGYQVKAFLEKIVTMTEIFRQPMIKGDSGDSGVFNDQSICTSSNWSKETCPQQSLPQGQQEQAEEDLWRYGSTYAIQRSFSPVLAQRMEEVSYLGKLALCHEQLDETKSVMARNIELILEQDERLENVVSQKARECNEMALVFKKKSKQLKRQMLWNNAKHGLILGTAITAGVASVAVPTLIAIL
mmetsp:Transcript_23484/g.55639  ORF Transcript_23484/g.55639 Transcript_23484/m.55639 type:complete len:345 (-) Transcript_23484:57-1091(-)